MRLAVDLRSLMEKGGGISGVENYVLNAVNALSRESAIEMFFFYNIFRKIEMPKQLSTRGQIKKTGIPNKIFNIALKFGLLNFERLYGDFDILWMPDLRPFSIKKKTKLVLTVHDLSPVAHSEFYSLKRRIWHWLLNYKKSFKRADLIFAVSEYTKYDLVKTFNVNPEKIKVVHPGVDHKIFNTELDQRLKHKVRQKYNLPEQYLLTISAIEPRKNLSGLIEAFERIADPEIRLVIAGRLGWLYKEILAKVNNSSKKDKIKMLGYVEEQDKPYLIAQAEMLCYPSFYEGFGFQPLEAMACGVPVISSARTSMPEVCGNAALLVEPYHLEDLVLAINSLLADRQLRETLRKRGVDQSQKFNWERTALEIKNHLKTLA